jgi:hypothetical protein
MLHAMSVALLLTLAAPLQAPDPGAKTAPVVEEETSVVIHVNLTGWDVEKSLRTMLGKAADEEGVPQTTKVAAGWVDALKDTGAKDLFLLIDMADMPGMPIAAVPVENGVDSEKVARFLTGGMPGIPLKWPAAESIRGVLVAGTPEAIARVRGEKPVARPELSAALKESPGSRIQIALIPSAVQRKALDEAMPTLPAPLGGGPTSTLTEGMRWASLGITFEPKPIIQAVVQGKDSDAAKALRNLAQKGLSALAAQLKSESDLAPLADAVSKMTPTVEGDRVTLSADLEKAAVLVSMPIRKARESARRSQCVNNLKQIGLAMHNYHSAHDTFPPAFTTSKEGKPLLSWRVLILPYLDQEELYKQFHLDESWDSPHNKGLISQMPAVYACPSGKQTTLSDGKTSYLTGRGPATMFPGAKGIKIQEITDGTSNTIMVVDANDDSAVTWTAPDDWNMPDPFDTKGLFGHHPGGTNFEFGDGSVRFIKATTDPKILHDLFTRNGGEVISADGF